MATRAAPTMFQRRMAARRGMTPIEQLSKQYQAQLGQVTQERERAFKKYQEETAPIIGAYESAQEKYGTEYKKYLEDVSKYSTSLADYEKLLQEYQKSPYTKTKVGSGPVGTKRTQEGEVYMVFKPTGSDRAGYVPRGKVKQVSQLEKTPFEYFDKGAESQDYFAVEGGDVYQYKGIARPAKFEMAAPVSPTAPTKPDIPEFEVEPYRQKIQQAEETYKREVGERKAGRLAAVSRRRARPLLGG